MTKRACLLILDGAGYSTASNGNAVTESTLPAIFSQMQEGGFCVLDAAAEAVGLEAGQVGNSEAGHLTIGAGTVVLGMTRRILRAYEDGSWAQDEGWKIAREHGRLHLVGLVSDAGVHGMLRTIVHAAEMAHKAGVAEIFVHPVLDGVDSLKGSAPRLLPELLDQVEGIPGVRIGVVQGRKHFCDRSGNLDFSRVSVDALRGLVHLPTFSMKALQEHLASGEGEMSFPAHQFQLARDHFVQKGDPVLITSNRADRARQVARILTETQPLLMLVDPGQDVEAHHVFFPQQPLARGLAHELKRSGLDSVRIAEKCKFPHVTFFLNGFDASTEGEGLCVPSIPEAEIPTKPAMSVAEVTDEIVRAFEDPNRRAVIANIANLDQVGHLGNLDLATQAAEAVDGAFKRIAEAARANGWTLMVTSDHGNAELVENEAGEPFGSHTEAPVPFLIQPPPGHRTTWTSDRGSLAQVAATYLDALGLEKPDWMEPALAHVQASA